MHNKFHLYSSVKLNSIQNDPTKYTHCHQSHFADPCQTTSQSGRMSLNKLNIKEANDHLKQLHQRVYELENQVHMQNMHAEELQKSNLELQHRLQEILREKEEASHRLQEILREKEEASRRKDAQVHVPSGLQLMGFLLPCRDY